LLLLDRVDLRAASPVRRARQLPLSAAMATWAESALDAVLGAAGDETVSRLSRLLEACRVSVWEVGAAPVVAVWEVSG